MKLGLIYQDKHPLLIPNEKIAQLCKTSAEVTNNLIWVSVDNQRLLSSSNNELSSTMF